MDFPINNTKYQFFRDKHIKYCKRCLGVLPERCESNDSTLPIIAFFSVCTLDQLNALDTIEKDKQSLIDWIYSFQVNPDEKCSNELDYGFRGSVTCMPGENSNSDVCDKANIAMTYTALATLIVLGDDLSKVHKECIIHSLKDLQLSNGSFRPMNIDCENDMRFVYCATSVCYILQDWSSIDIEKTTEYIKKSRNYDGGIGQGPGLESHGGSTYCAVAALWLMGRLKNTFSAKELDSLKRWLLFRQQHGFQGRPNKPEDTCYTFWVGATLKLLDCFEFVNYQALSEYVYSSQDEITGGISKWEGNGPDFLHTYLGICGLLLYEGSPPNKSPPLVHPALNISQRAANHLAKLHQQWKAES